MSNDFVILEGEKGSFLINTKEVVYAYTTKDCIHIELQKPYKLTITSKRPKSLLNQLLAFKNGFNTCDDSTPLDDHYRY